TRMQVNQDEPLVAAELGKAEAEGGAVQRPAVEPLLDASVLSKELGGAVAETHLRRGRHELTELFGVPRGRLPEPTEPRKRAVLEPVKGSGQRLQRPVLRIADDEALRREQVARVFQIRQLEPVVARGMVLDEIAPTGTVSGMSPRARCRKRDLALLRRNLACQRLELEAVLLLGSLVASPVGVRV